MANATRPTKNWRVDSRLKSESLGNQIIEGVTAEGMRLTLTIPAGEIGNTLPLEIWSQFMKAAHRGKLPSDLPGDAIAAFPPPGMSVPVPPASVSGGRGRPADGVPPQAGEGRAGVFDRLFSRR